jgi:hypothetical protein
MDRGKREAEDMALMDTLAEMDTQAEEDNQGHRAEESALTCLSSLLGTKISAPSLQAR